MIPFASISKKPQFEELLLVLVEYRLSKTTDSFVISSHCSSLEEAGARKTQRHQLSCHL
jgi:hypothetical protein